jgi:hypothetical protein
VFSFFLQHGVIGNRTNTPKARQEQKHSIAEAKYEDSAYMHLENENENERWERLFLHTIDAGKGIAHRV